MLRKMRWELTWGPDLYVGPDYVSMSIRGGENDIVCPLAGVVETGT